MFQKLQELFKSRKQKGQSLIFFAAAAPIVCAFIGAAMDFGWLYYNQSRLQNAADSAATAGAASLLEDEMPLSDYSYTTLIPTSNPGLQEMVSNDIISNRVKNSGTDAKPVAGDSIAKYYVKNNWGANTQVVTTDDVGSQYDDKGNLISQNVKFESVLYGKDTEDYAALYYTVTLTTQLDHLFGGIMNAFGIQNLPAKAISVVKISHIDEIRKDDSDSDFPHGPTLYDQMKKKEVSETYPNWEEIKVQKGNNATAANNRSVLTGGAYYETGNLFRTEVSLLNGNAFSSSKGNPSNTGVNQKDFDDLFIDFQGEMNRNLTTNGDHDLSDISKVSGNWDYGDSLLQGKDQIKYSYRVHFPIMIKSVYNIRKGKEPPDCLYAFIEQEPIKQSVTLSDNTTYTRGNMSSVRQIIINNDIANTNEETDRPIIFFYEGPEVPLKKYHPELYDGDDYIGNRPFLPVILNLNADFRGIVFAPNNPVIINGNGKKLEGFVVAREFRRLKTKTDFENAVDPKNNAKKIYVEFTFKNTEHCFAEISTLKDVSSGYPSSVTLAGVKYVKIKVNINGWKDAYVRDGQWYTNPSNKSDKKQINLNGDTSKYSYTSEIVMPITYDSKTYILDSNSKFYVPVTFEQAKYSSGTVWKQDFSSNATMYVSGSSYTYTETYMNTEGEMKTKTTLMSIGDVQYSYIGTVNATVDSDGDYTEKPGDIDSFTADDKVRYDYINIFNLKSTSTYNSFYNVGLVNYTYLAKTEGGAESSHDMFFTTVRSKHVD